MKLSFFGADKTVTGSCHCLEVGGKRILIDCGAATGRGGQRQQHPAVCTGFY